MKFQVHKAFPGRRKIFQPGLYSVPEEMSAIEARCCASEGLGDYDTGVTKPVEPFRQPPRKDFAPENKLGVSAPETKTKVDGGRGRGNRAKPDAGSGEGVPGSKRRSGE